MTKTTNQKKWSFTLGENSSNKKLSVVKTGELNLYPRSALLSKIPHNLPIVFLSTDWLISKFGQSELLGS